MELASSATTPMIVGNPGLGGKLVHLVCVYNPTMGAALIYTNGVIECSQAVSTSLTNVSPNAAALGRSPWSSDPWLAGAIDEFRIYAGALQSSDVAAAQTVGPDATLTTNVSLAVSPSNGTITFNWPVTAPGFILETSSNLDSSTAWTPVTNLPVVVGSNNQITLPTTNTAMFFRLLR